MLLSMNWVKEYLQKPDSRIRPDELAHRLTMQGIAVDSVRRMSNGLDSLVVVARIQKIEPHPDADNLQITHLVTSDAPEAEVHIVVCGAPNIVEGEIVPLALPGAKLGEDLKIKVAKVRGVESHGMICSGKELGVSDDADGVLPLPKHAKLGEPVTDLLGNAEQDTIFELDLTPNRADCMSVLGVAREIAPLLRTKLREPKPPRFRISPHRTSSIINVEVLDNTCCPRYVARVLDNLQVNKSPDWMQAHLEASGIRPINNIVDVTNFVMLEYGQPLHAFDLRRIKSGTLSIAPCRATQDFTLLNGEKVQLEPGDILIKDGEEPVALAGIMGGLNSQVEADTTAIILESAAFDRAQIRRTARRLGLVTESSKRFERGVDLANVLEASNRASSLLRDSCEANVYHPPIDTNSATPKEQTISVDMREVRRTVGLPDLSTEVASNLLETIGISSHKRSTNILTVRLPSYRLDLNEAVDIVEEIARLNGYDAIPLTYPISSSAYVNFKDSWLQTQFRIKLTLRGLGLREVINYSFTSRKNIDLLGDPDERAVQLQNPISEEMRWMRTSLLPSLLDNFSYNLNRKTDNQRLFEMAHVYQKDERVETGVGESHHVAGLISGRVADSTWKGKSDLVDFYTAKGTVEELLGHIISVKVNYEPNDENKLFHPKRSAKIKMGLRTIGYVGELHPFIQKSHLQTATPIMLFEIDVDALKKYERGNVRFKMPSKFPSVEFDLAFVLDKNTSSQTVIDLIRRLSGELLSKCTVFDVYEGTNIPEDKKSVGFHLEFLSHERTLKDSEIESTKKSIIDEITTQLGGQLRA